MSLLLQSFHMQCVKLGIFPTGPTLARTSKTLLFGAFYVYNFCVGTSHIYDAVLFIRHSQTVQEFLLIKVTKHGENQSARKEGERQEGRQDIQNQMLAVPHSGKCMYCKYTFKKCFKPFIPTHFTRIPRAVPTSKVPTCMVFLDASPV